MSGSVNKAILVGNLTRDPECRSTQSGDRVANLSVATNEQWRDKNSGERRERAEYHRVVIWGKLAEIAEKYCRKGTKVYLEGKIQTRKWQDQNGQERYSTEIVLQGYGASLQVLSDGKGRDDSAGDTADYDRAQQGPLDEPEVPF